MVDAILEEVTLQMEINDPKYNQVLIEIASIDRPGSSVSWVCALQRRISVVRYLAELYNYRLVDSSVIFKVLYSLISFGVALCPDDPNATVLDPPDHLLRIRLVCVILDACGIYFNSGSTKKKLDYFFVFFQVRFTVSDMYRYWLVLLLLLALLLAQEGLLHLDPWPRGADRHPFPHHHGQPISRDIDCSAP